MPRRILIPLALCALLVSAALATTGATAGAKPVARAAAGCANQYFTSLRGGYTYLVVAHGTGCGTARNVELAWQNCRLKHGVRGTCHSKAAGFTCHEQRHVDNVSVVGLVSCKRGSKRVNYNYTQNFQHI